MRFRVGFVKGIVRPTPPKTELLGPAKLPVGAEAATEKGVQARPPRPRRAPRFLPRCGRVETHGNASEAVWEGSGEGCRFRLRPVPSRAPPPGIRHVFPLTGFSHRNVAPPIRGRPRLHGPSTTLPPDGIVQQKQVLFCQVSEHLLANRVPTQSSTWTRPSQEWGEGSQDL